MALGKTKEFEECQCYFSYAAKFACSVYEYVSLYLLLLLRALGLSGMQNGHCSFINNINQYYFFLIMFRLYNQHTIKIFLGKKNVRFPCVFDWISRDDLQINDEFIFTVSSGNKDALFIPNFQVKN